MLIPQGRILEDGGLDGPPDNDSCRNSYLDIRHSICNGGSYVLQGNMANPFTLDRRPRLP